MIDPEATQYGDSIVLGVHDGLHNTLTVHRDPDGTVGIGVASPIHKGTAKAMARSRCSHGLIELTPDDRRAIAAQLLEGIE